eukprot:PhM_4_TR3553/c0_g1_i1/m.67851
MCPSHRCYLSSPWAPARRRGDCSAEVRLHPILTSKTRPGRYARNTNNLDRRHLNTQHHIPTATAIIVIITFQLHMVRLCGETGIIWLLRVLAEHRRDFMALFVMAVESR